MTSILVVDDHPLFRKGLIALLEASGLEVVGEAASSAEAVDAAQRLQPDVVMMDLGLPDRSGITATAHIMSILPDTRIIVISMYDDAESVRSTMDAGAAAYVIKESAPDQVIAAIEAVQMGAQWIGSGVPRIHGSDHDDHRNAFGLTGRELEVADLLAKGLPNPVIAQRLFLTPKTVANYVANILLKLKATDRNDAIRKIRTAVRTLAQDSD